MCKIALDRKTNLLNKTLQCFEKEKGEEKLDLPVR